MEKKQSKKERKIALLKRSLQSLQVEPIKGSLYVKRNVGTPQFFHQVRSGGKVRRDYIPADRMSLAQQLAQQGYNRSIKKLLRIAEKGKLGSDNIDRAVDEVYFKICPEKRELIHPVQDTLEKKLRDWESQSYQTLSFRSNDALIYTDNKERVRSKSEKIIADLLKKNGITYKYECPLVLKDGIIFYPDFTFFNPYTEEEIYWEHHGLMGDGDYTMRTIEKIRTYEKNGIRMGRRLLVTFEGGRLNVDYDRVKDLIRDFLLPLVPPGARPRQIKDRQREVL